MSLGEARPYRPYHGRTGRTIVVHAVQEELDQDHSLREVTVSFRKSEFVCERVE